MIRDYGKGAGIGFQGLKHLIVGAGLYGATMAERIASDKKERVLILEKRKHIGGNSYSEPDPETGIECHLYGSHIFHTKSSRVWEYANRFASFNSYRHKVLSCYRGKMYPMPINLSTINSFYNSNMNPQQARDFLASQKANQQQTRDQNCESRAIAVMGRALYEAFYKNYTKKQWGMDPAHLPAAIVDRLPIRFNFKSDYFDDPWQGIPVNGYGALIRNMLCRENIDVILGIDYFDVRHLIPEDCLTIYCGPIDRLFNYEYGHLKWRAMRFEREILPTGDFQGTAVVNYPDPNVKYLRIHEYRHYNDDGKYPADRTVIHREYPLDGFKHEDPHYPVNTTADNKIYNLYMEKAKARCNILLGGRLGTYSYVNMDQTILNALDQYDYSVRNRNTK